MPCDRCFPNHSRLQKSSFPENFNISSWFLLLAVGPAGSSTGGRGGGAGGRRERRQARFQDEGGEDSGGMEYKVSRHDGDEQ